MTEVLIDESPHRPPVAEPDQLATDPSRFEELDRFLNEEARTFLLTTRLSEGYTIGFGFIRRAFRHVRFMPAERHPYAEWRDLPAPLSIERAYTGRTLGATAVKELVRQDDPLAHTIGRLEDIRVASFSEASKEAKLVRKAFTTYGLLLASVHGHDKLTKRQRLTDADALRAGIIAVNGIRGLSDEDVGRSGLYGRGEG